MSPEDSQFSDEAHKVAKVAIDLWKSNPEIKEREGNRPGPVSVMGAIRLLSFCEAELRAHSFLSSHEKLENGRIEFETLLKQDKQSNLPPGEIRTLGRVSLKEKLETKIREVFPSSKVFAKIDEFLSFQNGDASYLFRDMSASDMAKRALERCEEMDKATLVLESLSLYVYYRRSGFVPNDVKRYPFQDEADDETFRLFRASEDILHSGWFSELEKAVICKACHTSKPRQEKN